MENLPADGPSRRLNAKVWRRIWRRSHGYREPPERETLRRCSGTAPLCRGVNGPQHPATAQEEGLLPFPTSGQERTRLCQRQDIWVSVVVSEHTTMGDSPGRADSPFQRAPKRAPSELPGWEPAVHQRRCGWLLTPGVILEHPLPYDSQTLDNFQHGHQTLSLEETFPEHLERMPETPTSRGGTPKDLCPPSSHRATSKHRCGAANTSQKDEQGKRLCSTGAALPAGRHVRARCSLFREEGGRGLGVKVTSEG